MDDDLKNRYAIEMQKSTTYNLPRRSRYYHSMMDLDLMSKGEYMKLHERDKKNVESGIAKGVLKEKIRVIKKLYLNSHDLAYIADFVDENEEMVQKVIGMIESDPNMDDIAIAEVILSQVDF